MNIRTETAEARIPASALAPIFHGTRQQAAPRRKQTSALDLIDPSVCPVNDRDPDFKTELAVMFAENDVRGMTRLYEALVTAGDAAFAILTELRMTDKITPYFLENISFRIYDDTLAHAYAVADALKRLKPDDEDGRKSTARTLFDCAMRMDVGLDGAIAIVAAINEGSR